MLEVRVFNTLYSFQLRKIANLTRHHQVSDHLLAKAAIAQMAGRRQNPETHR
jgi:hypothetical protein